MEVVIPAESTGTADSLLNPFADAKAENDEDEYSEENSTTGLQTQLNHRSFCVRNQSVR